MLGRKERDQLELFITGSLRQLVPDDHVLARVDRVLDLSWLHDDVADLYCADNGRPGIDPEVAVRLMLAGFLLGLVHDRRLMREAQVNIAIRWFVGYGLHEVLPDHSSLTRIRQRWGAERFRHIFERTVKACIAAKIATGEIVHIDASLIRADVSWESLVQRHADEVDRANPPTDEEEADKRGRQSGKFKKVSVTDPDASMATSARNRRLEPAYKQHAVVDDVRGVILDVDVTTGEINEGQVVEERVDATMATTGVPIATATADAGYAYAKVYGAFERRGIEAVIPTKAEPIRSPVPLRRFRYDAKNDIVKCPRGKILRPGSPVAHGRFFYARKRDCDRCSLAAICLSKGRTSKGLVISRDYPALLRARRRRDRWSEKDQRLYQRHRWRAEGFHGEAKTWHGLARAVRRGLQNMKIQAYLTAAAINLKRLAVTLLALLWALIAPQEPPDPSVATSRRNRAFLGRDLRQSRSSVQSQTRAGFFNGPTVHKHRNLLAHAPQRLHEEISADYTDMIYSASAEEIEERRKAFLRKWRLRHRPVADSLEEAGDKLFAFTRLSPGQWKSARTTNAIERLHEEFKRRIKTQTVLPSADTAAMLFWALLASGQIRMRKVDGWPSLTKPIADQPFALAA